MAERPHRAAWVRIAVRGQSSQELAASEIDIYWNKRGKIVKRIRRVIACRNAPAVDGRKKRQCKSARECEVGSSARSDLLRKLDKIGVIAGGRIDMKRRKIPI